MQKCLQILAVDDDPIDLERLRRLLKFADAPTCNFATADTLEQTNCLLDEQQYDVLLLDLNLPDSNGLETLDAVRVHDSGIPIVVVTGCSDRRTALESLHHGAQDYLVKGSITGDCLANSIRNAVGRQHLLRQVNAAMQVLKQKNARLATLYQTAQRFVDNVSHEFRTPLTVIKGYASIMRDGLIGDINSEQCRFLDILSDRCDDLSTMVDDMLDVSRLEAGLLGVHRKSCRVVDIVRGVTADLQRKAALKGVTLSLDLSEQLPEAYCDECKVRRIIINLVANAIKFCDGAGSVSIWSKPDPRGPGVVIGVTDTGPGIEESELQKIFQRFQQLDVDIRASCKGFGLGLRIVQELVALNLGEMSVASKVGEGSTFSFTLPPAAPLEVMTCYLNRLAQMSDGATTVCLLTASVDGQCGSTVLDDVDAYIHGLLRRNDLAFRVTDRRWLLVIACTTFELDEFCTQAAQILDHGNRNRVLPLPEVTLRRDGEWHLVDQRSDLLASFNEQSESREMVHA